MTLGSTHAQMCGIDVALTNDENVLSDMEIDDSHPPTTNLLSWLPLTP